MSKLNLTRKTFLEKEELNRFQDMLEDSSVKSAILGNTTSWGIIRDEFETEDLNFKVENGTNSGTIKISKAVSKAIGSDGLVIRQPEINNITVTDDSLWYWVKISHKYRRWENGEVNLSNAGDLSGIGTSFLEVLRGQTTKVPTKVRFLKENGSSVINSGVYEVVVVGSNISAVLSSSVGFTAETGLKMVVVGATPISEVVTDEQLEGLYKYDDCKIEFIAETEVGVMPTVGYTPDTQFYIARVKNTAGTVTIEDKREKYWNFNVPGVTDRLSKFENLNDLSNKEEARTNLDVYNKDEVQNLITQGSAAGALLAANNLSDLVDTTEARSNLGVLSTIQVNEGLGLKMDKAQNLNDVADKPTARTNLEVPSSNEVNEALGLKADKTNVLEKNNETSFIPTGNFQPVPNIIIQNIIGSSEQMSKFLCRAVINEDGTIENQSGMEISCTRQSVGSYFISSLGQFGNSFSSYAIVNPMGGENIGVRKVHIDGNAITVCLADDSSLNDCKFSIHVFNYISKADIYSAI